MPRHSSLTFAPFRRDPAPRARVNGRRRHRAIGAAVLASAAVLGMGACAGGEAGQAFHSIGTGGTGGVYYPLGGSLAARLSAADSAGRYTAEVTGGSVENVNRVMAGQIDLGFALGISAYEAYHNGIDGGAPASDLRVIAPLYPNVVHVLAASGSGIGSVADFAGRRVSVGSAGSGTEQTAQQVLAAYGLSYDDVSVQYLSFSESAAALRDGALDAAILSVGFPAAAVLEATTAGGVELVAIDGAGRDALLEAHPYYDVGTIPGGAYPGADTEVATVSMNNWLVGRADLDTRIVDHLLTILRDDREELGRVHEMAGQIDLAGLARAPIPLHPAAEAFVPGG
ncbi:TAXI family TRAP transporter solute-binding subunit [Gemmatimonadota bacterium DH-20]|uniref:TAXI family TRAP transporter solute-binding subunit n=1 Tax=Gaopeijia maritima TaxID=3119007 RepID=A0ABU9E808_9BACT